MKKYQLTFFMTNYNHYRTTVEVDNISAFVENVRFLDTFHIDEGPSHQLLNLKYMISLEVEELHEWPQEIEK